MKYDDNQMAIKDFEALLARTQNPYLQIAAYNQMGLALQALGKPEESIATIDKAINMNVLHPVPYLYKAKVLYQQGKSAEGCEQVDKAITFGLEGDDLEEAEALKKKHCED
jgi:tetratricopeptide (TPR) repeat protein